MKVGLSSAILTAFLLGFVQFSSAQTLAEGLPLEIASAGVTEAQWEAVRTEIKLQSRRAQVSEQALLAVAEATGARFASSGRYNSLSLQQAVFEALKDQADQLADLQAKLDNLINDTDPAIGDMFNQARDALNAGHLLKADRILADVAARDLAGMQSADADVERLRTRAGETIASRAKVAFLQADYLLAAEHFGKAAATAPQSYLFARAQYYSEQARSLSLHGRTFSELSRIHEAVAIVQNLELPIRESVKDQLAILATRLNLGIYLANLGELGDEGAAASAIEILSDIELPSSSTFLDGDSVSLWRSAQNNLGSAYRARATDIGSLVLAEKAYRRALKDADLSLRPWDVAADNLASTLALQAEVQATRVSHEAFELFEHALSIRRMDCCAHSRAQTLVNLANAESINGEFTSDVRFLQSSLRHYSEALSIISPSSDPRFWAMAQRGVGLAYDALGNLGDLEAFGKAASAYEDALISVNAETNPKEWIELHIFQARSLHKSKVEDNLSDSIRILTFTLSSFEKAEHPALWADANYELGMAQLAHSDHGGIRGIDSAILALQDASLAYSGTGLLLSFAIANQNLGVAYERKANRSNSSYFPAAADAYKRSLTIYSKEKHPEKWALAQASLGNALRNMGEISGDISVLRKASEAYQLALEIYSKETTPREWGDAWNNLGSTYVAIGDRKSLESALKAYALALQVRTPDSFPDEWSSTQLNLGAAHIARFEAGKKRAINDAIGAFENSLSTRSRSADPAAWGRAKYALALGLGIYSERVNRDRLDEAILAAQDAVLGFRDAENKAMMNEAQGLLRDLNLLLGRRKL